MMQSVNIGHRVTLPDVGLFSDGTAVKLVGEETFRIVNSGLVDGFMTVDTDAVCAAIKDIFIDTRSIVEPAGALAVAAIKEYAATRRAQGIEGETYAAILCGANMNFDRLRFVAERAEVGEEREALLAVTIPEERGSFRRFCELIGNLPTFGGNGPRNVTEFNYRISDMEVAHVFVGLTTFQKGESSHIAQAFHAHGFEAIDLTHNELAKEHIRYMVGGPSTLAEDERLLRFVFPERPGALLKFLSLMQPNWNISLFHYRNQGADFGRILVGLQVPAAEETEFQTFLHTLGYPFVDETRNPVYHLFLQPKAQGGYEMSPVNPTLPSTSESNLVLPTVIPITHASLDAELRHCIDFKTKPMGALGRLESLALQIGLVQKTTRIRLEQPQMVVFAADHGITDAKVSAYPQAVTVQMVLNMLAGGAAVNVFARQHGFTLTVVDAGVATPIPTAPVRTQHDPVRLLQRKIGFGTRNMARGPAMTMAQAISALHAGMDVIEHLPGNVIAFGEMGIGNTSSAALLFSRLTDVPLKDTVGRGTGLNDEQLKHKLQVLMEVSRKHHAAKTALELLSAMGGFEIAMMAGAMIQAAHERRVILIDGFITGAAALVAQKLAPPVVDYMVFCHRSAELGHRLMLTHFNAQPLLDLDLRLGEGSGALLAWPLLQSASAFLNEMASFEAAGVSQASTH
jgi:nicotinate-nucleotide--dimethylbenzimidazole phosphoribosyltransferase